MINLLHLVVNLWGGKCSDAYLFLQALQKRLDSGIPLPLPDALLINGLPSGSTFTGEKGNHLMKSLSLSWPIQQLINCKYIFRENLQVQGFKCGHSNFNQF